MKKEEERLLEQIESDSLVADKLNSFYLQCVAAYSALGVYNVDDDKEICLFLAKNIMVLLILYVLI